MQETRRARLQSVILEELSLVVRRELKDPRIPSITFTRAEVTVDGSQATVYVMLLGGTGPAPERTGDAEEVRAHAEWQARYNQRMKDCLAGLISASGFLRRHLGKCLDIKHIPNLIFKEDKGFENANRIFELLKEIGPLPPDAPSEPGLASEAVAPAVEPPAKKKFSDRKNSK